MKSYIIQKKSHYEIKKRTMCSSNYCDRAHESVPQCPRHHLTSAQQLRHLRFNCSKFVSRVCLRFQNLEYSQYSQYSQYPPPVPVQSEREFPSEPSGKSPASKSSWWPLFSSNSEACEHMGAHPRGGLTRTTTWTNRRRAWRGYQRCDWLPRTYLLSHWLSRRRLGHILIGF